MKERAAFTPDQGKRIADATRWVEKFKHQRRPQALKPRFTGGLTGPGVIRFELVSDLTMGSHAEASILKLTSPGGSWTVNEDVENIQVFDWFQRNPDEPDIDSPGMWSGKIGMRGWAVKRAGATAWTDEGGPGSEDDESRVKYDIIWMEQLAAWIEFAATEDIGETESLKLKCDIVGFDHQGISPDEFLSEEEDFFVYDPFGTWNDVITGSKGHALYDYSQEKYYIVYADRVCIFATANLTEDLEGESTVGIDNFAILYHGDFNRGLSANPTTALNPYAHAGPDNSAVLLMRTSFVGYSGDPIEFNWMIVDIQKRESTIITEMRWDTSSLEKKVRNIWAEYVDEEPLEWQTVVTAVNCIGEL